MVHASAPGCHGESLAEVLHAIDEWRDERHLDISVRVDRRRSDNDGDSCDRQEPDTTGFGAPRLTRRVAAAAAAECRAASFSRTLAEARAAPGRTPALVTAWAPAHALAMAACLGQDRARTKRGIRSSIAGSPNDQRAR